MKRRSYTPLPSPVVESDAWFPYVAFAWIAVWLIVLFIAGSVRRRFGRTRK